MEKKLTNEEVDFDRAALEQEWDLLKEKCKGDFVNPKDVRRMDEITSLLITDGEAGNVRFKLSPRGNGLKKGTHNLQHGRRRR